MRTRALVAAAVVVLTPLATLGGDAPHDLSSPDSSQSPAGVGCRSCHAMHVASGPGLSNYATQFDACNSCHQNGRFIQSRAEMAIPGSGGKHHGFEVALTNASHGALPPTNSVIVGELAGSSTLTCSTCHDQHAASPANGGGQNTSSQVGVDVVNGAGRVQLSLVATTATAKGYLIDIVGAGAAGAATFRLSNDGGTSWFQCTAPTTYTYSGAVPCQTGTSVTDVPLNDGALVKVRFSGTFAVGNQFRFWVSYPFLRVSNVDAALCIDCHRERVQSHVCIEGGAATDGTGVACTPNGARTYSHPVNEALANSYDRTATGPLDADGSVQTVGDANPTNNLVLGTANKVTCLTCHSPHFSDSNSLTSDEP